MKSLAEDIVPKEYKRSGNCAELQISLPNECGLKNIGKDNQKTNRSLLVKNKLLRDNIDSGEGGHV